MPHARHGGRCVREFAVVGSKFEGIGLEKEQMGQIQVALGAIVGVCTIPLEGLSCRIGVAVPECGDAYKPAGVRIDKDACLLGFGNMVILGEDFRKRAYISA
jgi:hypothetical protein